VRIALVTFGSRGDVTPLFALGSRLRSLGHTVRLVTHREFEPLAAREGLEFRGVAGSYSAYLTTPAGRRALGIPTNSPRGLRALFAPLRESAEAIYADTWEATADVDAIASSALAAHVAGLVASLRDLPFAMCPVVPAIRSRHLPHAGMPPLPLGQAYNRLSHSIGHWLTATGGADVQARWVREARRLAGARAFHPLRAITLVPVSPTVVPRPLDWPDTAHVTGFWLLPNRAAGDVPERVRAFVESGPPPLCLGFGSMPDDDPDSLRAIVRESLRRLSARAVVVAGSGGALFGFEASDTNVCEVPSVDYGWLFPRVKAVIHQGGIGTASYCLRAGVPQVTVPYCLDHAFWAWRFRRIGVAPPAVNRHRLTADNLTAAVRRVLDEPGFAETSRALAPAIESEDGVDRAAALFLAHANGPAARATAS
jgi:sterol 3beta-glucosyltransferase